MFTTHYFDDTGEAYDSSQWRDDIKDGDLLVIPNEGVYGFLYQAWPIAYSKTDAPDDAGTFHKLRDVPEFMSKPHEDHEGKTNFDVYDAVWQAARALYEEHNSHHSRWRPGEAKTGEEMLNSLPRGPELDKDEPLEGDFGPHLRENCPNTGICVRHAIT